MGTKISDNFIREEVMCKCQECSKYAADIELVERLEWLRQDIRLHVYEKAIINVHSWFRCRAHNNRPVDELNAYGVPGVGSNDNSWHLFGGAVDIDVPKVEHITVARRFRAEFPDKYGLGIYDWGLHIDIRPQAGNWDNRTINTGHIS